LKTIKKYATLSAQYHKRLKIRDGPREMKTKRLMGGRRRMDRSESGN
jgi:hypothetical protein